MINFDKVNYNKNEIVKCQITLSKEKFNESDSISINVKYKLYHCFII
jgi:hypothetical protein